MICTLPAPIPFTMPDVPMVAIALLSPIHVPPVTASVSVILLPTQTLPAPDTGARALMVATVVAVQPVGSE